MELELIGMRDGEKTQWEGEDHRKRRHRKEKLKIKRTKKLTEFQMVFLHHQGNVLLSQPQDEHNETIEQVTARHQTDPKVGLTRHEVEQRLARDGPNVLTPVKKKPEWLVFLEQFTSVFAMLLWVGAFLSFVLLKAFSLALTTTHLISSPMVSTLRESITFAIRLPLW